MTRVYTKEILESECIGNSLSTINLNFSTLDNNLESLRINKQSKHVNIGFNTEFTYNCKYSSRSNSNFTR